MNSTVIPEELSEAGLFTAVTLDVTQLTTAQIIKWYSKHPNATVRNLAERLALAEKEKCDAYAEGVAQGLIAASETSSEPAHVNETRGYW